MRSRFRVSAVVAFLALAVVVHAEEPPTPPRVPWRGAVLPEQWRGNIPPSAALAVPEPVTRDEDVEPVTLKQVIGLALENNPGIAAQRLEPTRQEEGILQAQAEYDPTLRGELNYRRAVTPNASVLGGSLTSVVEDRYANLHLLKLFRSGTQVTIDSLNDRLDVNSRFNQLRPQYTPSLNFSLIQPLLQNFGWDFTYLVVRVAEQTADAAVYQYEATLADFVQQVIATYWTVVGARETVEVDRQAKELADRTVQENEARVRVGLLPPVSVLEAQADAASRQSDLIAAENTLAVARQTLAQRVDLCGGRCIAQFMVDEERRKLLDRAVEGAAPVGKGVQATRECGCHEPVRLAGRTILAQPAVRNR